MSWSLPRPLLHSGRALLPTFPAVETNCERQNAPRASRAQLAYHRPHFFGLLPDRAFRVFAGSAEVVDLGTKFDVRLERDSTVVTVVEGRVAVGPSNSSQNHSTRFVQLSADQQIRVTEGEGPTTPVAVDAQRATAWLHRQIVFDNEPLERVAAEYNRYTSKPIEIATPALRNLKISGVFATDDPEAFIAFLRSLKGVRVEVTETRIRVW